MPRDFRATSSAVDLVNAIIERLDACRDTDGIGNHPIFVEKFDRVVADLKGFVSHVTSRPVIEAPAPVEPAPVVEPETSKATVEEKVVEAVAEAKVAEEVKVEVVLDPDGNPPSGENPAPVGSGAA